MLRRTLVCCGLALFLTITPRAATADAVDDYVAAQLAKKPIPGLAVAVIKEGKVVKSQGYGLANVELKAPASDATLFELGSITKQFTATAIMMLVEAEKVRLDEPISTYLDDLPDAWKAVTVRQLLNHTSGIKSYTDPDVMDFVALTRTDFTPTKLLALVRDRKSNFAPGTDWAYCNTGYFLLGLIVEKASGQRYSAFLKERIFDPLKMTQTRMSNPEAIIPNRSAGYGEFLGKLVNRDPIRPTTAFSAGALISTVGDMARWDAALRAGTLLKSESLAAMTTPAKLASGETRPYGFGWAIESRRGHKAQLHGGGTAGFSTMFLRLPDDDLSVIVLTNLSGAQSSALAFGIAGIYLPDLTIAWAEAKTDPDPKLTERLRGILADILADKLALEPFSEPLGRLLESPNGKGMAKQLNASGPLKSFTLISRETQGKALALEYKVILGETVYLARIHINDDGKITGLKMEKDD